MGSDRSDGLCIDKNASSKSLLTCVYQLLGEHEALTNPTENGA